MTMQSTAKKLKIAFIVAASVATGATVIRGAFAFAQGDACARLEGMPSNFYNKFVNAGKALNISNDYPDYCPTYSDTFERMIEGAGRMGAKSKDRLDQLTQ